MMYNSKALLSAALLTGSSLSQSTSSSSGGGDAQCTQSYASLLAGAPTPDGQLASAITSYASGVAQSATGTYADPLAIVTQVCAFSSGLPSSLQSDFDSYVTQVISYVSASSSDIDAVITNCVATGAEGASYTSLINSFATQTGPLCEATGTGTPSGTANGTVTYTTGLPTPTSSGANGGSSGGATTSPGTNAAALPTAVFGGAAAAAGLLGAIALL